MYVPSVAHGIHQENLKRNNDMSKQQGKDEESRDHEVHFPTDHQQIPLKGIGIGNGLIDVQTQAPAVIDWGYWHGLIDIATRDYLQALWDQCYQSAIHDDINKPQQQTPPPPFFNPFTTGDDCGFLDAVLVSAGDGLLPDRLDMAPNMYDATTWDTYPAVGGHGVIHSFYNNPKVQELLHAPVGTEWHGCQIHNDRRQRRRRLKLLDHDRPLSMLPYLAELMDEGNVKVLIYNGDLDISVNAQGSEAALNRMQWSHADQWYHSNRSLWIVHNDDDDDDEKDLASPMVAGYVKQVDRLHFVIVRNSGHMVSTDIPYRTVLDAR
jgi:Serine carboxypeptidase